MRLTRRQLVQLGAAGLASLGAVRLAHSTAPAVFADDEAPRLRSDRHTAEAEARDAGGRLRSVVHRAPYEFNAVGAFWTADLREVAVRTSPDGRDWSPWLPVSRAEDHAGPDEAPGAGRFGDIHFAPGGRYIQLRWLPDPDRPAERPAVETIDSVDGPDLAEVESRRDLGLRASFGAPRPVPVVGRQSWGADEKLRLNKQGKEIWAPEYRTVQKCVVHHTATELADADYPAAIRAIYRYHAATRGWGDIGYNFLIDPRGNVYEGRAGGPNVVGGHALRYNWGSVGIAMLGDFDKSPLPAAAKATLIQMLAWKSQYLNPHDWSYFVDRETPNLFSHRDCLTTECPGDMLQAVMPELRDGIINLLGAVPQPAARVSAVAFTPDRVFVGGVVKVEVTVENVGTATLPTAGPAPSALYRDTETFATRNAPPRRGAFRVGADLAGTPAGVPFPYQWGLPDALEPGQSARVTGYIRATAPRDTQIWAALLREDDPVGDPRLGIRPLKVTPAVGRVNLPFVGGTVPK